VGQPSFSQQHLRGRQRADQSLITFCKKSLTKSAGAIKCPQRMSNIMKTKGLLFTTAASVLLAVGLSADQPYNLDQLPEDCALAAAPRALQTFRWLDCAPEPRSVWASSDRPRDPEVLTSPRALETYAADGARNKDRARTLSANRSGQQRPASGRLPKPRGKAHSTVLISVTDTHGQRWRIDVDGLEPVRQQPRILIRRSAFRREPFGLL